MNSALDFNSILDLCRLCATQYVDANSEINIFSRNISSRHLFLQLIEKYLGIEVSINESLPQKICSECTTKIQSFDIFSQRCHEVQEVFFSVIQGRPLTEKHQALLTQNDFKLLKKNECCIDHSTNSNTPSDCPIGYNEVPVTEPREENISTIKLRRNTPRNAPLKVPPLRIKAVKAKKVGHKTDFKSTDSSRMQYEIHDKIFDNSGIKGNVHHNFDDDCDNEDHFSNDSFTCDTKDTMKTTNNPFALFEFKCHACLEIFKNFSTLKRHCNEEHNLSAYVSCVCGKQLRARTAIIEHRRKHTGTSLFKCDTCSKTFNRRSLMCLHMVSHMPKDEQPHVCCKCAKRFHTASLLKKHEKVHLPEEERFLDICHICQKKFTSKSALNAHLRAVHYGEKPFICEHCGNSFSSKAILTDHLTTHSSYAPWPCNVCGRNFKSKYRLNVHMDMHRAVKYRCPRCPMELSTRRTLRMHLLVHKEEKAYVCKVCSKAFRRSKDLKNHSNLHTGRRPYKCEFCERTFANGSNCRAHKLRMHPEELGVQKNCRHFKQPKLVNSNIVHSELPPPATVMPINVHDQVDSIKSLMTLTEVAKHPAPAVDYMKYESKYEFSTVSQELDYSFDYGRYTTPLNLNTKKPTYMQQANINHIPAFPTDINNDITKAHFLYS